MQTKLMNKSSFSDDALTILDFVGDQHCLGSISFFYNHDALLDATSASDIDDRAEELFLREISTNACFFFTKIKRLGNRLTVCVGPPENICSSRRVYKDKVDYISLHKFHGIPMSCVHYNEVDFLLKNKDDILRFFKESGGIPTFFVVFSDDGVITEESGVTKLNSVFGSSFTVVKTKKEEHVIYNENVITCLNLQ